MTGRHIVFHCNGDSKTGMGHVIGSIRLANLLEKELSICPIFLVKKNEKVIEYLNLNNIQHSVIPHEADIEAQINEINNLSEKFTARTVSFNLNADELKLWGDKFLQLKEQGFRIIFQDNPMPSFLFGDMVINALPHPKYPGYYPNKHKHCFDGLDYLLFDDEVLKYQNRKRKNKGEIEQILIALGGSDHKNITSLILKILADIRCDAYIDVVLGPVSEHISEVEKMIERLPLNAHLSYNVNNMPERIWNADVGFSTLGLTTYEMAALKLPCLIIAPNSLNEEAAEIYVKKFSLAKYAGYIDQLNYKELKAKIERFLLDRKFHENIILKNRIIGNIENYRKIVLTINEIMNS